jgi:hypothetical protein
MSGGLEKNRLKGAYQLLSYSQDDPDKGFRYAGVSGRSTPVRETYNAQSNTNLNPMAGVAMFSNLTR